MWLKRLIAVLLMLWLPIQTASAVIMPFCKHAPRGQAHGQLQGAAHDPGASTQTHVHGDHCNVAVSKGGTVPDNSGKLPCDQCDLCQLACASFMPVGIPLFHGPAASVAVGEVPQSFHSVLAVVDDRPPWRFPL